MKIIYKNGVRSSKNAIEVSNEILYKSQNASELLDKLNLEHIPAHFRQANTLLDNKVSKTYSSDKYNSPIHNVKKLDDYSVGLGIGVNGGVGIKYGGFVITSDGPYPSIW